MAKNIYLVKDHDNDILEIFESAVDARTKAYGHIKWLANGRPVHRNGLNHFYLDDDTYVNVVPRQLQTSHS